MEVICKGCNKKMAKIENKEGDFEITVSDGVIPSPSTISMGMLVTSFECPKCKKVTNSSVAI